MANVRRGNTWYVDTPGAALETGVNLKLVGLIITPSAAPGSITLSETSQGSTVKFKYSAATANSSVFVDLSNAPVVFNGIYVQALSNAVVTLILSERGNA